MGLRWKLAGLFMGSWAISFAGLWAVGALMGDVLGSWAILLIAAVLSLPLVAIAVATIFILPERIARRPFLWGFGAAVIAMAYGWATFEGVGLTLAAMVAAPGAILFGLWARSPLMRRPGV